MGGYWNQLDPYKPNHGADLILLGTLIVRCCRTSSRLEGQLPFNLGS
jgi:hypothetical protein